MATSRRPECEERYRPARSSGGALGALGLFAWLALCPSTGHAAEFYLTGQLGISSTEGEASGSTPFFSISGSDEDASPAYGATLGFAFGVDEAVPRLHVPRWREIAMPAWGLRVELEGVTGRDYELRSEGGDGFFTEVESSSFLLSTFLDLPVHPAVKRFFGRRPVLEPLRLYAGAGIGRASLDVETTDNVSAGEESASNTAFQYGLGVSYVLTPWTTVSLGYRVLDLGDVEVPLSFQPGTPFGSHEIDFETREIFAALRYRFYAAPLADMHPRHWRLPAWPFGSKD